MLPLLLLPDPVGRKGGSLGLRGMRSADCGVSFPKPGAPRECESGLLVVEELPSYQRVPEHARPQTRPEWVPSFPRAVVTDDLNLAA